MILGIDEVGRGCWAGPLVVGAVVLGGAEIEGLTDSKKLTKRRRNDLYDIISEQAMGIGLGWVSAKEIDEFGLSAALCTATRRAVQSINTPFHEIIIDGTVNFLRGTPLENHVALMKKADLLIPSVSAASIIAKVSRDRYMEEYHSHHDGYGFSSHVGYGTAAHRAAIDNLGVTPEHRLSFAPLAPYRDSNFSVASADDNLVKTVATTSSVGYTGETAAAKELERRGHKIITRNWKSKYCEIDIISKKEDTYYFTEVKHRRNDSGGDGLEAITTKKHNQMKFAASLYAHVNKLQGGNLRLIAVATSGDVPVVKSVVEID